MKQIVNHKLKKYIKQTDLAYVAEVIDSDGCISINKNKGLYYVYPRVEISQIDTPALKFIKRLFNFTRYKHGETKNNRQFYTLLICGKKTKPFLLSILPFLKIKKKQAKIVIKLCNLIDGNPRGFKTVKTPKSDTKCAYSRIFKVLSQKQLNDRLKLYKQIRKLNSR
jgi:hypothetical protein